jgi:hypothetical protein
MNLNLAALSNPTALKIGAGAALYLLGGSRTARLAGVALAGWGVWGYLQSRPRVVYTAPPDPGTGQFTPWAYPATHNLGGLR